MNKYCYYVVVYRDLSRGLDRVLTDNQSLGKDLIIKRVIDMLGHKPRVVFVPLSCLEKLKEWEQMCKAFNRWGTCSLIEKGSLFSDNYNKLFSL